MLKPDVIQNKEFEQSVLGGYRRDEVDAFLDEVEADYRKLYNENIELVEKLKVCLAKIEDYKKDEEFLKTAIINAQKLNETTLKEIELREKEMEVSSKAKAAEIIAAAEEHAKAIVLKAERESADAVRAAREQCRQEIEAEQAKSNAEILRIHRETEAEQNKLDHLRSQVAEFKNTIIELYKAHLTSISKLPDFKSAEEKSAAQEAPKAEEPKEEPASVQEEPKTVEPEAKTEESKSDDNTVEFKLAKKNKKEEEPKPAGKPLKFENLKFGVDYDVNNDE
ncbi:MAG: DivIVA domain-containing protein [Clostridia bacterium]|nr:DivIVA domain-containing protein [Clostridia bacterium]